MTSTWTNESNRSSASSNPSEAMYDEERDLLKSMGLLDLLDESGDSDGDISSQSVPINDNHTKTVPKDRRDNAFLSSPPFISPVGVWARLRNQVKWQESNTKDDNSLATTVSNAIGGSSISYNSCNNLNVENGTDCAQSYSAQDDDTSQTKANILLGIGGALFILPHLAILLSLPPVLQRRGAPYLPSLKSKLNLMFDLIRIHVPQNNVIPNRNLKFVDLGSGDGRVVFRAAREGLFYKSVGYEINPTLHLFAQVRKLITPKYWKTTRFECRDLWNIRLNNYDVIAVYGLAPIMDRLGTKMKKELKPGSLVVSNVFEIPGWRTVVTCSKRKNGENLIGRGVYLYKVPECFEPLKKTL